MDGTSQAGKEMREQLDLAQTQIPSILDSETEISVIHMNDSSKYIAQNYGFKSWKEYWAKKIGCNEPESHYLCPSCQEFKDDIDGGHVVELPNKYYITPICSECNGKASENSVFRTKPFKVKNKDLVPFNLKEFPLPPEEE